jgi:hypothetical protein
MVIYYLKDNPGYYPSATIAIILIYCLIEIAFDEPPNSKKKTTFAVKILILICFFLLLWGSSFSVSLACIYIIMWDLNKILNVYDLSDSEEKANEEN